jgi:hypothetical protein
MSFISIPRSPVICIISDYKEARGGGDRQLPVWGKTRYVKEVLTKAARGEEEERQKRKEKCKGNEDEQLRQKIVIGICRGDKWVEGKIMSSAPKEDKYIIFCERA